MDLYSSKTYIEDLKKAIDQTVNFNELFNQTILIAGATGLIGSYLADILLTANQLYEANITVYAVGRNLQRLQKRFSHWNDKHLKLLEQDITEDIIFNVNVDYIIHAASNAYPAAFNSDPVGTITANIIGTKNLLDYTKVHSAKRFLYISSGEIYGEGESGIEAFEENYSGYVDPLKPRSCYPVSKRAAENLCISYAKQYGVNIVIVRPCHTYGPNATSNDNRANVQFVNDVLAGRDIVMKSTGTQMRSYCYIPDCASAILRVLLKGECSEAYNIAYSKSRLSIAEFAELLARQAGKKVIFELPDKIDVLEQSPIPRQVLASEKLESLCWKGSFTPEIGIDHLIKSLTYN